MSSTVFGSARCHLLLSLLVLASGWLSSQLDAQSTSTKSQQDVEKPGKLARIEQAPESFDLEANLAAFDEVWSTINKVHWDEDKVGQTWDDARATYRPLVEQATTIGEVREILNNLIGELGQSHFSIIPQSAYEVIGGKDRGGAGDTGLDFRAVKDGVAVTRIRPGSPAEKAGVKTGWLVEAIGDKPISELAEKLREAAHGPMRYETLAGMALPEIAKGKIGDKKKMVFRDGDGKTQELEIELEKSPGKKVKFGYLPEMQLVSESKTLDGNVGYYRFNMFFDPVGIMKEYRDTIRDEKHSQGIVIDLRGNIGGMGAMTMGMASEFAEEEASLGVMTMKGSELKFVLSPNYDPISCPVAILIDECSVSSAEIFSGGLKDLGLARVFGSRSAGLALPSMVVKLPNGDGFQYAIADYHSASGKSLELDGVVPDETIELSQQLLLNDSDPVLHRALQWIQQQNQDQ